MKVSTKELTQELTELNGESEDDPWPDQDYWDYLVITGLVNFSPPEERKGVALWLHGPRRKPRPEDVKFYFDDSYLWKYDPQGYPERFELLLGTPSGTQLASLYKEMLESRRHKTFTEPEIAGLKQLVIALWIDAHREAGFLEDSEPYLQTLDREVKNAVQLLTGRVQAERELAAAAEATKLAESDSPTVSCSG